MMPPLPPVVLVLAGHDPTGGAGLVADSEAIAANGGWALTIPTALTVQNCHDVSRVIPADPELMLASVDALADMPVAAIKIGLLADAPTLIAAERIVRRFPGVPVVVDPVLKAGGGADLSTPELCRLFVDKLLAHGDILTPNRHELARLTPELVDADDTARAVALLSQGSQGVLVTGTDDPLPENDRQTVTHTLHTPESARQWQWPRLPDTFHGSGCTLAAALAARLAAGEALPVACEQAQHFTWQSLSHGYRPAHGQRLPNRLFHDRNAYAKLL
ncbi:bifunctional hydroxymethylpyrimidine kinase/phosphomethylpyrimidine kinase [Vreelandella subglaciescola]|jgi:hydroxymethylpyrimidine/phosphomethylpyrimidine kinase|uniref:Hydroxymethylpyrimidine/phosphomethylpyrimidine kinase n=1 Tax=Vreelandella subglaciescola TaxID=29571 RepID=A0A1M7H9A7_9GAMM|nr:bifunctional hydroxymethylpyrimidine kinase/phosphomethylpyrimidine kinase [Halomonas subglaciescola]SHM24747.1 hydroxymethylpyrimidine/phosphomethylpyrimidine kinase [Halomonas subglaciescola]